MINYLASWLLGKNLKPIKTEPYADCVFTADSEEFFLLPESVACGNALSIRSYVRNHWTMYYRENDYTHEVHMFRIDSEGNYSNSIYTKAISLKEAIEMPDDHSTGLMYGAVSKMHDKLKNHLLSIGYTGVKNV